MDVVNALAETWPRRAPLRRAFAEVAQEHLDDVYRYLVFLTADPVLAEDLTGETFEKAFRSWKRFNPRRGSERTWLCQLARSKALDHFRSESRRRRREDRSTSQTPQAVEPRAEGISAGARGGSAFADRGRA
jgi:RNA polymerase sigma factor (sigma-70 family)